MPIKPRSRSFGSTRPGEHPEAGVTLVELLVTMALLAIILTALAGSLVVTLRSITQSEQEVIATQLASEEAESVFIGEFDFTALYEGEIATASDWQLRLDSNTGKGTSQPDEFEGGELVTVPGPPAEADGGRDDRYPKPVLTETREGIDFRLDRYITWIDRDGDGNVETKRLSTFVSWTNNSGESRELRFDSERVPSQDEAAATDAGTRVIQFTFTPDPVQLDSNGEVTQPVDVFVRTNEDTFPEATLQFYTYNDNDTPDDATDDSFALRTVTMAIGEPTGDGGYVTWTATIPPSDATEPFEFANGAIDILFQAADADGATVQALGTLNTFGAPSHHSVDTPTPDGTNSGEAEDPTTDPDPDEPPPPGEGPEVIINVTSKPGQICVNSGNNKLKEDLVFTVFVDGLTQEDGLVTMTYPYLFEDGNELKTAVANDSLDFVQEVGDGAEYTTTITRGSKIFEPGSNVTFDLAAERNEGYHSVDTDTESFTLPVKGSPC